FLVLDPGELVAEREGKVRELTEAAEQNARAINAATLFEIDDVIDPAETRRVLASTLAAAGEPPRSSRMVDAW
ncbi:MAG: biotin carboxylase, partial [Solirubrobacterales bacterium]